MDGDGGGYVTPTSTLIPHRDAESVLAWHYVSQWLPSEIGLLRTKDSASSAE